MDEEELRGLDYIMNPTLKLIKHPDFNPNVMRILNTILDMTTAQLEELGPKLRSDENG